MIPFADRPRVARDQEPGLPALLDQAWLQEFVARTLAEDIGAGDVTTQASLSGRPRARARILSKEAGIVAGIPVAREMFRQIDSNLQVSALLEDGDQLATGLTVLEVAGSAAAILTAERCVLNVLQQLSGVATKTARFVAAVAETGTRILDTRKTVPGLRALQKYAVRCGGGSNHRFGLDDRFMFKDNHLALLGSALPAAIARARVLAPNLAIEVEADRLEQVKSIVPLGVDYILLDNMSLEETRACVEWIAGRVLTEASGKMSLERVRPVAETGVDFISVGELTHSVRSLDLGLEII